MTVTVAAAVLVLVAVAAAVSKRHHKLQKVMSHAMLRCFCDVALKLYRKLMQHALTIVRRA